MPPAGAGDPPRSGARSRSGHRTSRYQAPWWLPHPLRREGDGLGRIDRSGKQEAVPSIRKARALHWSKAHTAGTKTGIGGVATRRSGPAPADFNLPVILKGSIADVISRTMFGSSSVIFGSSEKVPAAFVD
ncbi:hypothetical protein SPHINGO8AM_190032 [Sphingomonas sp. 8AM]|nr:hypothetical protein SPHINGO8AM_190032 [Sphingomonas sp. 8AM]